MISVREAAKIIAENSVHSPMTPKSLDDLRGDVLREPLCADRPHPPYDRVAMDGIAIRFSAWETGQKEFFIEGCQAAGEEQKVLSAADHCLEVMTGAVLPKCCDTVIRYEDITLRESTASVVIEKIIKNQNIHHCGADYKKGDVLVAEGTPMFASHIAAAATIGKTKMLVSKQPSVAIISTGSELVSVFDAPDYYQIRRSNPYAIKSCLGEFGFYDTAFYHFSDDLEELRLGLSRVLSTHDVTLLSGGVSMGKFDFIPQVLGDLRVKCLFHKVNQRPGKPLWFGLSAEGKPVFGLPGNPVSTLICTRRYVVPYLILSLGSQEETPKNLPYAVLTRDLEFKKPMTYFIPVSVKYTKAGTILADPVPTNGSGDYVALAQSDGFIELPDDKLFFAKEEAFPLYLWRGL